MKKYASLLIIIVANIILLIKFIFLVVSKQDIVSIILLIVISISVLGCITSLFISVLKDKKAKKQEKDKNIEV